MSHFQLTASKRQYAFFGSIKMFVSAFIQKCSQQQETKASQKFIEFYNQSNLTFHFLQFPMFKRKERLIILSFYALKFIIKPPVCSMRSL